MGDDYDVYDAYLKACRAGRVETPARFFDRHPTAGHDLRKRVEMLFDMLREGAGAKPFEKLGEFRLIEALDAGGMGNVYLAEQTSLDRVVALKVIRPELQNSREATLRFEREAQAVARLRHDNIVAVFAAGTDHGVHYLAMEVVPGRGLDDLLAEGRIEWHRAVRWAARLARALAYAHAQGIVHRDVKPSNVRITPDDQPLLLDFGVAYDMGADLTKITRTFAGSPAYAAPEQIDPRGGTADGRTDVYALGVTLYQCLTGTLPFTADTVERVFAKTLTEDAVPPRHVERRIPRDVDVVVRKAMEKDPARRYQSAADLADDLEAILAHRPIRARPPGPVRRVLKWSRRHPAWASVAALLLLVGAVILVEQLREAARRRAEARQLVAEARDALQGYRDRRAELLQFRQDVNLLRYNVFHKHTSPEEDAEYDRKERLAASETRLREETFQTVRALLRQAEQLDPGVAGVDNVLAELYFERWESAWVDHDEDSKAFYRRLIEETEPAGRFAEEVKAKGQLVVRTDPEGAEIYLFRYREPDERRWVPEPANGGPVPAPPGTWVLRVVKGAGGIAEGDHVLDVLGCPIEGTVFAVDDGGAVSCCVSVNGRPVRMPVDLHEAPEAEVVLEQDGREVTVPGLGGYDVLSPAALAERGGVRARVEHGGEVKDATLPAGLTVRATAAPAFLTSGAHVGRTPWEASLEAGTYLVVLRHEGYETLRFSMLVSRRGRADFAPRLHPTGTTPPGWVFVPTAAKAEAGVWMMEREVTCGEYLEFLNQPETLAQVDAAPGLVRAPRGSDTAGKDSYFARGEDGRFRLEHPWRADWPIVGVTYGDAEAYVAWRSQRDGRRYALPDGTENGEWGKAWRSYDQRRYPFGWEFRPKFVNSCFSRYRAEIEPVLSYPIDESPVGVFDLCGSAREWLDAWFDEHRGHKLLGGGSWGFTEPGEFLDAPMGLPPAMVSGAIGFRMVWRR